MTITIGYAIPLGTAGKVQLRPPGGFNLFDGLRLTNNTVVPLVVSNPTGVGAGWQEYLLPGQQNVYPTQNVQKGIEVSQWQPYPDLDPTMTPDIIDPLFYRGVLVEWTDNLTVDFPGTYPVAVGPAYYLPEAFDPADLPEQDYQKLPFFTLVLDSSNSHETFIGANALRTSITLHNNMGSSEGVGVHIRPANLADPHDGVTLLQGESLTSSWAGVILVKAPGLAGSTFVSCVQS